MTENRIYNFNAGPAVLPLPVLKEIQASFLNFNSSGMSIVEISHRSKWFDDVINDAVARTKRLLKLDDKFHVLFLQGGASLQFAMIPMNFLAEGRSADYVNTGTWSTKAIKEAKIQKENVSRWRQHPKTGISHTFPKTSLFNKDAVYAHITSNNTIKGTQWQTFPDTGDVPMIADMSSDFMSRRFDRAKIRDDLRRRPEKYRPGRGLHGDRPG